MPANDDDTVRCPQCGSENVETRPDGEYHCRDCDALFRSGAAGATISGPESVPDEDEEEDDEHK